MKTICALCSLAFLSLNTLAAQKFIELITTNGSTYHIEQIRTQRVQVTYATTLVSPETKDGTLYYYALVPPETEMQKPVSVHVSCQEVPNLTEQLARDENDSTRFYKLIKVPLANELLRQPIHLEISYTLDLFDLKFREGAGNLDFFPTKPTIYDLRPTKCIDYTNSIFQDYLRDFKLIRSTRESNLAFAYRAFQILSADLAKRCKDGATTSSSNWRASYLCQRGMECGGCGNCSIQFVAILRANGVPARLVVGRWAKNSEPNYGQYHVRADFFDPSIGWIPVDPTFGFCDWRDGKNVVAQFGNCNYADFITMHLNTEVHPWGSHFEMPLHQFAVSHYVGSYPYHDKWTENWTVKKLPETKK